MDANIKLFEESEICAIYSIQFTSDDKTEFQKFLEKFEADLKYVNDFDIIINTFNRILERGSKERYFRPEGKFADRVCALPIDTSCLRIYCIRLSDSVLIVGNGGVKDTATYQENDELKGYVLTLQRLDSIIKRCEQSKVITVTQAKIEGIDDINFEL